VLDLVTGRYPAFLFGFAPGQVLPVFHLHEVSPAYLEPRLRYLAENQYRTAIGDAVARFVRDGVTPGPRTVVLCFDDAWASLWTVAAPLLRRYGLTAVAFAIPGRIRDAVACRPTLEDGHAATGEEDRSGDPFCTWPEIAALHASGTIDVQSHSWSHAMVFSGDERTGFLDPRALALPRLDRPTIDEGRSMRPLGSADLGAPLYVRRSRFSDAWRFHDDEAARARCVDLVRSSGGAAFFDRPDATTRLEEAAGPPRGHYEDAGTRDRAVREDLGRSREELNGRLGTTSVRHLCFPWGIAGDAARDAARAAGFETAYSDHLFGRRIVAPGDNPYRLMRLHDRFIFCLPGRGRTHFFAAAPRS
jgi:peptidoglycan/xylan/chitin deacetylase (PgdA/CDA1 family)